VAKDSRRRRARDGSIRGPFSTVDRCATVAFQSIESLKENAPAGRRLANVSQPAADAARLLDRLEQLRSSGELRPSSSSEVLRELREMNVPGEMSRDIAQIEEKVDNYEYDDAAAIAARLIERVE
jgi:hypothetical protein